MCRWFAYSGSPVDIDRLLLAPKNSLIAQSQNSPLGAETVQRRRVRLRLVPGGCRG